MLDAIVVADHPLAQVHVAGLTACERAVRVAGVAQPLRLIIAPLPPEKATAQRKKVARKASKKSHRLDPRTTQAAGYLMLLTSLPAAQHSSEAVLSMYRNRWQIELAAANGPRSGRSGSRHAR